MTHGAARPSPAETPPLSPFSSAEWPARDTVIPAAGATADDDDDPEISLLCRLTGSAPPSLGTFELSATTEVEEACGAGPFAVLLFSLAALSLALTLAASASRSEAASLAAMRAIVSGDCWGGGRGPTFLGRGSREAALPVARVGESGAAAAGTAMGAGAGAGVVCSTGTLVLMAVGWVLVEEGALLDSWVGGRGGRGLWLFGDALADLFGRVGGGMSVVVLVVIVVLAAGGARLLDFSADLGPVVRADEDVVAAVALVVRCLVGGLVGVLFLGSVAVLVAVTVTGAAVARVALVAGLLGAGVSFLAVVPDRVDLAVVVLEVLETEDSGDIFTTSRLSCEESVWVKTAELGLESGFSSCDSAETLSLFFGDSPSFVP